MPWAMVGMSKGLRECGCHLHASREVVGEESDGGESLVDGKEWVFEA